MERGEEKTIVIVDDEEPMRDYLREVLTHEGYHCRCFTGSLAALAYMASNSDRADLILTDINMPGMGGVDLLRTVKTVSPELPVILISRFYGVGLAIEALKGGAADYLLKPAKPDEVAKLVARHLEPGREGQRQAMRDALREFLSSRDRYHKPGEQVQEVFDVLGFKRYETLQHSKRVAAYAVLLGEAKKLSIEELRHIELGALLHDIGKIAIPHNDPHESGAAQRRGMGRDEAPPTNRVGAAVGVSPSWARKRKSSTVTMRDSTARDIRED